MWGTTTTGIVSVSPLFVVTFSCMTSQALLSPLAAPKVLMIIVSECVVLAPSASWTLAVTYDLRLPVSRIALISTAGDAPFWVASHTAVLAVCSKIGVWECTNMEDVTRTLVVPVGGGVDDLRMQVSLSLK